MSMFGKKKEESVDDILAVAIDTIGRLKDAAMSETKKQADKQEAADKLLVEVSHHEFESKRAAAIAGKFSEIVTYDPEEEEAE